jgi:hypothetical protein
MFQPFECDSKYPYGQEQPTAVKGADPTLLELQVMI